MAIVVGVDGCRGGWLWVAKDLCDGAFLAGIAASFGEVLTAGIPTILAVDIPIGLPETGSRICDKTARAILGPRASSVFPSPIRPMLQAHSYPEACAVGESREGRKISRQGFAILPKIREVDACFKLDPSLSNRVREIHPELCFWAMNGNRPMSHPKRTPEGAAERSELISAVHGEGALELGGAWPKGQFANDDLLDALAALWTAERIHRGQATTFPEKPPLDSTGLRMEMWT